MLHLYLLKLAARRFDALIRAAKRQAASEYDTKF